MRLHLSAALTALFLLALPALATSDLPPSKAQSAPVSPVEREYSKRWDTSVHGQMLRRILPPGPSPETLPEPRSEGAQLLSRYCVQCHHLPSPAMHTAANWPRIFDRMVWRMEGKGNMGELMKDMMTGVEAPTAAEKKALLAYLKRYGQTAIDPKQYPDLASPEGQAFEYACSQCHSPPDPKRFTAKEWPLVVKRMQEHLAWHGVIVGGVNAPRNAVSLDVDEILAFLTRHSRQP
jgi:mono/diheme cytochrome c family protein